jgi:N-methylhydantoinase A
LTSHEVDGLTRIGVDVGGTFTDLIFYDARTGEVRVAKEPTTPAAPDTGVMSAVTAALSNAELEGSEYFLHGTTVGLNALLERRGGQVGLLTTRGFRDVLEMRRGDAEEPYNLFYKPPAPLVPRRLRLPVTERMRANGTVHVPLIEEEIEEALQHFDAERVECIAVVFLNAYANPDHELRAEAALRRGGFEGPISLSHRVSGEYREYERTCTTVIDAYVRPRTSKYLGRVEEQMRSRGFEGSLLVTRSGGGAISFGEAHERPFETILSGPVAGAEGAGEVARALGLEEVITADVGGTSFDTCIVRAGRPNVLYQGEVVGLPVQTAWVDVRSIGAGGGSVAYVDVGGLLRVGPRSAGAVPGPACYGRGGTEPTVTDAAFVLGMLGTGRLASGIELDGGAARAALLPLADALGFDLERVAQGIITIASVSMANAIRAITVEQGQDPREAALMPFGGAGPLFGTLLASELEIPTIVVPSYAGNFSAWGLLGADLAQTAARTRISLLSDEGVVLANATLEHLFAELKEREAQGRRAASGTREVALDIRYLGQEHSLTLSIPSEGGRIVLSPDDIRERFTRQYERTFGHSMDEVAEIVSVRATVRTALPRRVQTAQEDVAGRNGAHRTPEHVDAYSFSRGERLPFRLVDRAALRPGEELSGPAIVTEDTATTYLDAGFAGRVHETGSLILTRENA